MAIVEPSKSDAPVLEDGLYPVTCQGVDERTVDNDMFGNKEKLEFHLLIEGETYEDGEPVTLDPRINRKWSEKATLYEWALAFGLNVSPEAPIDTDLFKGKKARAIIETAKEGDWPRVKKLMKRSGEVATTGTAKMAEGTTADVLHFDEKGDPKPDWNLFWALLHRHGLNKKHVIDAYGPVDDLDLFALPTIADALIARATA
jgi:hypothetical protein